MEDPTQSARVARFGAFEVDPRAGELRRNGARVRLQEQPFQILTLLLERPGQVISREELRKKLWPDDTFVDFDHSLGTAIGKLREALGDSAERPRYIETLPRRGYRFIGPVEQAAIHAPGKPSGEGAPAPSHPVLLPQAGTTGANGGGDAPDANPSTPSPATHDPGLAPALTTPRPRWWTRAAALVAIIALIFTILTFWFGSPPPAPRPLHYTQLTYDGREKPISALLTDGLRIYFLEATPEGRDLVWASVDGGEVVPASTHLPNIELWDDSTDGAQLLVGASEADKLEKSLWVLPPPGGSPRPLGKRLAHAASWSPDGRMVAYASGKDICLTKADGSESPRTLLTLPGRPSWLRWSPDGKVMRFTMDDPNQLSRSLWELSVEGARLRPLLPGWNNGPDDCCGEWTPDGKYYVFVSSHNDRRDIWALRQAVGRFGRGSTEPVQLTAGPMSFYAPRPSNDGRKLFVYGADEHRELLRYDDKSGHFIPYLSTISADYVDFSRDGKWVVYTRVPGATLWRSRVDGSEQVQLTFPPKEADAPQWSPDGKRIAFRAALHPENKKIYVISSQGGDPEEVIHGHPEGEGFGTWSPDGNSLLYGDILAPEKRASGALHVVDLRTKVVSTVPGSRGLWTARWFADGRIAALTADCQRLMLFDPGAQAWHELARNYINDPRWSSDGKYIYFDHRNGEPAIYRVRVKDGKLELVASLKDFRLLSGSSHNWSGLAPDGSPLLARGVGSTEIYALDWQLPW